jgi:hypothetical protein
LDGFLGKITNIYPTMVECLVVSRVSTRDYQTPRLVLLIASEDGGPHRSIYTGRKSQTQITAGCGSGFVPALDGSERAVWVGVVESRRVLPVEWNVSLALLIRLGLFVLHENQAAYSS